MSLYRHDQKKKNSFLKNIDFWDTLFQCKKETLQKYPCSMTKYKRGLAKNSLQLIFKMTTPGMNLRDLNMHFPHAKFLNSWLIWGLSVFTSLFIFKNKQTNPLIQRVCSNILFFFKTKSKIKWVGRKSPGDFNGIWLRFLQQKTVYWYVFSNCTWCNRTLILTENAANSSSVRSG